MRKTSSFKFLKKDSFNFKSSTKNNTGSYFIIDENDNEDLIKEFYTDVSLISIEKRRSASQINVKSIKSNLLMKYNNTTIKNFNNRLNVSRALTTNLTPNLFKLKVKKLSIFELLKEKSEVKKFQRDCR